MEAPILTIEEATARACKQRPGVVIVMGTESATECAVHPLGRLDLHRLPGPASWHEYHLQRLLGYVPCLWAMFFAAALFVAAGRQPTVEEWHWLNGKADPADARKWLAEAAREAAT